MREEIGKRDGPCILCRILGPCGECRRSELHHDDGRVGGPTKTERWNQLVMLCVCHHKLEARYSPEIKAYRGTLKAKGTRRFNLAFKGRPQEWEAARKGRRATAKTTRTKTRVALEEKGFTTNFVTKKGGAKKKRGSSKYPEGFVWPEWMK